MSKEIKSKDISIYHPKTIFLALFLTGSFFTARSFYSRFLKRIPTALDIPTSHFRKKYSIGKVTSVGDGDNFHFYHTPGGILGGWGWLRSVPSTRKQLKNQTWSVRICGVDAPERAHFGNPAQPHSQESLDWLKQWLEGKRVKVKPLRIDQYNRVVSRVLIRSWLITRDVSEEMLRHGTAIIYEGKNGSEFDGQLEVYKKTEAKAKKGKIGVWGVEMGMSPGEYKRKHRQ